MESLENTQADLINLVDMLDDALEAWEGDNRETAIDILNVVSDILRDVLYDFNAHVRFIAKEKMQAN